MSIKHLDKIVSLCKRKGFVFPNSEIYGGLKASYDYGPLGVELKKSISEIHKVLSEAKGGWKALIWAAGAGGAVVAVLGTLYQILGSK